VALLEQARQLGHLGGLGLVADLHGDLRSLGTVSAGSEPSEPKGKSWELNHLAQRNPGSESTR
jgi:hypothetical protein